MPFFFFFHLAITLREYSSLKGSYNNVELEYSYSQPNRAGQRQHMVYTMHFLSNEWYQTNVAIMFMHLIQHRQILTGTYYLKLPLIIRSQLP